MTLVACASIGSDDLILHETTPMHAPVDTLKMTVSLLK